MNPVFDYLADVIENAVITFYLVKISSMNEKYNSWKAIAVCLITASACFIMNRLIYYEGFLIAFYVLFYFIFLKSCSNDPWYSLLLNTVIPFTCIYLISLPVAYYVQNNILPQYPGISFADIQPYLFLVTRSLLVLVLYLITRWKKKLSATPDRKTVLMISAVFLLLFSAVLTTGYILFTKIKNTSSYILIIVGMIIVLTIVSFIITGRLLKLQSEKQKLEGENQIIRSQLKDQKKLMEYSRQIQQERHNLKHVLKAVEAELVENNNQNARNIIIQQLNQVENIHEIAKTGNAVLDYFLNDLRMHANKKGIDFTCEIADTASIPVSDEDLGLLLGNLFDNAIENCNGDNARIRVMMHNLNNFYYIEVRNSTTSGDTDAPSVETSKKEDGHGYGIRTIHSICRKYNGSMRYYVRNYLFCFVILLPE